MDRDPQHREETGSLDVFDEMASDSDTKPAPATDEPQTNSTIFESGDALNLQYDSGVTTDVFAGNDDDLDFGDDDDLQASEPYPQLNLPDEHQDPGNEGEDPGDELDFNGPTEPITITDDDPGDGLVFSGPDEPITATDAEPVASVQQGEGLEPVIADGEANQAQPVDGDDDEPVGDQDSSVDLPWPTSPDPDSAEEGGPQSTDLPSAFSQPEPAYEFAVNTDFLDGYSLTLPDDDDEDMDDG